MITTSTLKPPMRRARRLRRTAALQSLVRETSLGASSLVYPVFAAEAAGGAEEIAAMPGQHQHDLASLVAISREAVLSGVTGLLVFGVPATKDPAGTGAWARDGISQRAIAALKAEHGDSVTVIADLCLCEYTSHGHCGLLDTTSAVDNDRTLEAYQLIAVSQAEAGADVIAPSGMMDGQVAAIRSALDESGHDGVPILAYSAKYHSGFYGPFREAAGSAPQFGDRSTYQLDPANRREAILELDRDLEEGADMLMVKPALAYLDVLAEARARYQVPVAAYNVSAEYSMVKAAGRMGWIDERRVTLEILTSIRRAGADFIISYHALEAARWLNGD